MPSEIRADLDRCQPVAALAETFQPGHWRLLPYRSATFTGVMLGAGDTSTAPAIAYPAGASGQHRISVGFFNGFWRPYREQRLEIRLSGEETWTTLVLPPPSDQPWGVPLDDEDDAPQAMEVPWRVADLTGRTIELRQPRRVPFGSQLAGTTGAEVYIAYLRLEPIDSAVAAGTDRSVAGPETSPLPAAGTRRLFGYNDTWNPFFERPDPMTPDEGAAAVREEIEPYRGTDFARLYWEAAHGDTCHYPTRVGRTWAAPELRSATWPRAGDRIVVESWARWLEAGFDPFRLALEATHAVGLEFHATYRFGWGAFYWPPPFDGWNAGGFFERRSDLRALRRDGTPETALSFAFPEVRVFTTTLLSEVAAYPVDGIALLFNRQPPFVGSEPHVVAAFRAAGGADPATLPPDDEAWLLHRAGSMTAFLRELRAGLDRSAARRLPLTAWVYGTRAENLGYGLDVEAWVRDGLVDTLVPYSSERAGFSWAPAWTDPASIAWWRRLTDGTPVLLAPNLMPRDMSDMDHRRTALGLYRGGIRALSFWDAGVRRSFVDGVIGRLGHVDELEAWDAAGRPEMRRRTEPILEVGGWRLGFRPE